jgi:hypothetical protein
MARTPKVYDQNELLRMRIVDEANANGASVSRVRDAARLLALHVYTSTALGWEREILSHAVAEVVTQKLGVEDHTTLGEELWLMIADSAKKGARYGHDVEHALSIASGFIESGEVSRWARLVLDHIS